MYFICASRVRFCKTMIRMIMKILIQWFCYLYVLHLWCIKVPQNAQTYMACVPCRTQRSRRWRCFLWDILFMWFLWLLTILLAIVDNVFFFKTLLCFTKEYLLSTWSHKGPSIFKLGLIVFLTVTQWFWSGTENFSQGESQDSP